MSSSKQKSRNGISFGKLQRSEIFIATNVLNEFSSVRSGIGRCRPAGAFVILATHNYKDAAPHGARRLRDYKFRLCKHEAEQIFVKANT